MNTALCIGPPQLGPILFFFFLQFCCVFMGRSRSRLEDPHVTSGKKKKSCEDFLKKAEELLIRYYNHL